MRLNYLTIKTKNPGHFRDRGYRKQSVERLGPLLANDEPAGGCHELLERFLTGEEVQPIFEPHGVVQ